MAEKPGLEKQTEKLLSRLAGPAADEISALITDRIRLWRYKSAVEILSKAQKIAEEKGLNIRTVPTEFLVPFLEKSTLINEKSPLVDNWARLLASASKDFSSEHLTYSQILSELSPEEARLFQGLYSEAIVIYQVHSSNHVGHDIYLRRCQEIASSYLNSDPLKLPVSTNCIGLKEAPINIGISCILRIRVRDPSDTRAENTGAGNSHFSKTYQDGGLLIHTLLRQQIIEQEKVSLEKVVYGLEVSYELSWVYLTRLGFGFMEACGENT